MRPRGFQWFVAWRYVMARPRKISLPVLIFAGACGVVSLGAGIVASQLEQGAAPFRQASPMYQPLMLTMGIAGALAEISALIGVIRYFFSFFTTVSMVGVLIGSKALVIVLSVMNGFESDLRDKILGSNAHIQITKDEGEFTEHVEVTRRVAQLPGVIAAGPYLVSEVVIAANQNYANVIIKGVEPLDVAKVTDLSDYLDAPRDLQRLWPLHSDGGVRDEAPPDAGPVADAGPQADAAGDSPDTGGGADVLDPAPPDMNIGDNDPIDLSGAGVNAAPRGPPPGSDDDPNNAADDDPGDDDLGDDDTDDGGDDTDDTDDDTDDGGVPLDTQDAPNPALVVVDPAPDDMDIGDDAPLDLSGGRDPFRDGVAAPPSGDGGPPDEMIEWLGDPDGSGGTIIVREPIRSPDDAGFARRRPSSPRVNALDGVLVGRELVRNLHLYRGQEVTLVSPIGEITPAGLGPKTKPYRVAGMFYTGMYEYDTKMIYVDLGSLQRFLSLPDEVNGIEVRVPDPDETDAVMAALRAELGEGYRVQDWKELNRNLFSALKLEKIAMFLVLAIIILVASFSIIGNLVMVVVERGKEIALLKTLGASNVGVMKIFIVQGLFIGVVGTLVGVLNGLLFCFIGKTQGLPLDPDVYYIDKLPISVDFMSVLAVAAAGVLISVFATIYPAWVGARLRPVQGLRYE